MTKEFLVECDVCKVQFYVVVDNSWAREDVTSKTKEVFNQDKPQNCARHAKQFETIELPLNGELLAGQLEDPGNPKDVKLPVFGKREGHRREGQVQAGMLTPTLLKVLQAWDPEATIEPKTYLKELAEKRKIEPSTLKTYFSTIRETLGAASNEEAWEIAKERGLLEE